MATRAVGRGSKRDVGAGGAEVDGSPKSWPAGSVSHPIYKREQRRINATYARFLEIIEVHGPGKLEQAGHARVSDTSSEWPAIAFVRAPKGAKGKDSLALRRGMEISFKGARYRITAVAPVRSLRPRNRSPRKQRP